ncbi:TonB family protein [Arcticibacterium luteifluviistationis]|uniref:TonB C-terminal domain-containing protein n=1 Tax=Arcticibacterium luteifluviistationis TaxID=1784714 RepID=A0A2Z4GCT7_9BACT|nr:TonB family protein [Arcticibacterium luteifluviistationis]AWV98910.1 hypothetical protein DJ013_12300 [Arcticibacterium luteifluviistationis]
MNWITYIFQVNLYLIITFGFYWFVLRKETFYNANRFYLLTASILSFAIPFWQSGIIQSWAVTAQVSSVVNIIPLEGFTVTDLTETPTWDWNLLLANIYFLGFGFGLLRFSIGLFKLQQLFNLKNLEGQAFSVFGKVFIDKKIDHYDVIKNHEEVHSKEFHSLDVFWFELLGALCWFNPVAHFMQKEIKLVHEYIADAKASEQLGSKKAYAKVLVSSHFKTNSNVLVNHFYNKSILKTRIMMLSKEKSKKKALLKYGLIVPIFLGMLIISAANVSAAKKIATEVFSINNEIVPEIKVTVFGPDIKPLEGASIKINNAETNTKTDMNGDFLLKNIPVGSTVTVSYPGLPSAESALVQLKTTVIIVVLKPLNATPAKTKPDKLINSLNPINEIANNHNEIFTAVENNPEFPGGANEMYKHIAREITYPAAAQTARIEGRVFVKFVVRKDGSVGSPEVLKGLGFGCDEEAIRIINEMPTWNPGIQNGKPVNVYFTMPIFFQLE